tara:strand:- start:680 stop:976 length:297 start_codon:yes stop_codon:yes gene_type:complete
MSKNLTAAAPTLTFDVRGFKKVALQLDGTFTGTVSFEASVNGRTFVAFNMTPSNSGTDASSATAVGAFSKDCGGYLLVQARFSTATSGTVITDFHGVN